MRRRPAEPKPPTPTRRGIAVLATCRRRAGGRATTAARKTGVVGVKSVKLFIFAGAALLAGCQPAPKPPPSVSYAGLPVSGTLGDARRAGFTDCVDLDASHIRCRRRGVMVDQVGPYDAAIDLVGRSGAGGFDQLTLWHDTDNDAVFNLANALERMGWDKCLTGNGRAGDQAIYTRPGAPVRVSMDISYWGRRRLRLIPEWDRRERGCVPATGHSAGRNSGTDR